MVGPSISPAAYDRAMLRAYAVIVLAVAASGGLMAAYAGGSAAAVGGAGVVGAGVGVLLVWTLRGYWRRMPGRRAPRR
jgi:hypothetical protein